MRAMWEKYYLEADVVIYIVDSVDLDRMDEAKKEFIANIACDRKLLNTPIILAANKQDVPVKRVQVCCAVLFIDYC